MKGLFKPRQYSRKEKIHFLINIGIGIIISLFFHAIERTTLGETIINKTFDRIVAQEARKSAERSERLNSSNNNLASGRIVFVDLSSTYIKLGKPLIMPRDEIAGIVKSAYEGGAKVILLDVLFEDEDCCNLKKDEKLRSVLKEMTDNKAETRVIFPVRIGCDNRIRRNIFHDFVKNNPKFYFAMPAISASFTDRIIRYWVPYENPGNDKEAPLWNAAFLTAMLALDKEETIRTLEPGLTQSKLPASVALDNGRSIEISDLRDDIYRKRIRFLLIPPNTLPHYPGGNLFESVVERDEIAHADFKNKIVIIGNSNQDAGDKYVTPAGNMAGMYIIGNAVNTILLGLQPARSPWLLTVILELVVIVLTGYFFLRYHPFLAKILGSVGLFVIFGFISYYYFHKTGVFLNFTFAVMGMGFYEIVSGAEKLLSKKRSASKA